MKNKIKEEICENCGEKKIGHHFKDSEGKWWCYETRDDKPSLNKRFKLRENKK